MQRGHIHARAGDCSDLPRRPRLDRGLRDRRPFGDLARDEAGEFSPHAWRACAKFGIQGLPILAEAAAAKLFTSEAWVQSSLDAIQIHGAYGYMKEAGIERDLRDAVAGTIYSGTSEIQRVILSRMLGL